MSSLCLFLRCLLWLHALAVSALSVGRMAAYVSLDRFVCCCAVVSLQQIWSSITARGYFGALAYASPRRFRLALADVIPDLDTVRPTLADFCQHWLLLAYFARRLANICRDDATSAQPLPNSAEILLPTHGPPLAGILDYFRSRLVARVQRPWWRPFSRRSLGALTVLLRRLGVSCRS